MFCLAFDRFVHSTAWKTQSFVGDLPVAIPESEYLTPPAGLLSNDQRKNFTDMQETAQWLGGVDVARKILSALGVHGTSVLAAFVRWNLI